MNLYVHFPFCRAKCTYCALFSRVGASVSQRSEYVARLASEITSRIPRTSLQTVYFGGGSPALCDLTPLFEILRPRLAPDAEWTVELHPCDVSQELLDGLRAGGVNRLSLGVQSFDERALSDMQRGHTAEEAEQAFRLIRSSGFKNAGIDLIAGWPGTDETSWRQTLARATALELDHCSVYSLIHEPKTRLDLLLRRGEMVLPDDEVALSQIQIAQEVLASAGLRRYEISNYARSGSECRHNLAVWRGEDYLGLGDGAHGRENRLRTVGEKGAYRIETLSEETDALERAFFALRLPYEGLDLVSAAHRWPILSGRIDGWRTTLETLAGQGIAHRLRTDVYALTARGLEVCDAVLSELL